MIAMELDAYATYAQLPQGFKFHEWSPGNLVSVALNENGNAKYHEVTIAIERISDKSYSPFELSVFPATRGVVLVDVEELSRGVENAIEKLK